MVIQSFIQMGTDVVSKIKAFEAISWPILAMPALERNLVYQITWCQRLFLCAVCGWGCTILMSFHLLPWTTHLSRLHCPWLPTENSSTNLFPSTGCPKKGDTELTCAVPVSGANHLSAVTTHAGLCVWKQPLLLLVLLPYFTKSPFIQKYPIHPLCKQPVSSLWRGLDVAVETRQAVR